MKKRVTSDTPVGLLAYKEKEPIAWCSLAPRDTHERLGGDETFGKSLVRLVSFDQTKKSCPYSSIY